MSVLDRIAHFLAIEPMQEVQTRQLLPEDLEPFDVQMARLRGGLVSPWRQPSIREALSVPAIFRAVTLISNTIGGLALEAWRNGIPMDQGDAPKIIVRPNPFSTPREFHRETAWSLATRGEAWWWIAARDIDDAAMSLYPMPAHEVTVEENERNLLRPIIKWRDRTMRNDDVVQLVFAREPGELRGVGPLQLCGAAVSVAVEAQAWAANFFSQGGVPSVLIKSAVALSEDEAKALKLQWAETPANLPRVTDPGIEEVKDFSMDPEKAQLTDTRRYGNGESARMFGIPGSLLGYVESGSSLTYQNISQVYDEFVRACLLPNYIEPMEQGMSDLLTRSTVARFSLEALLRADVKTRYEVYASGITSGVLTADEARVKEGLAPGDIERAPVPWQSPTAIPASLPIQQRTAGTEVRCPRGHLLAELATPPYRFTCPKCKGVTSADPLPVISDTGGLEALTAAVMALAAREQPAPIINVHPAPVSVESPVTIAEGAIQVTIPPPLPEPVTETIVTRDEESGMVSIRRVAG